jgi:hypothetical protein
MSAALGGFFYELFVGHQYNFSGLAEPSDVKKRTGT